LPHYDAMEYNFARQLVCRIYFEGEEMKWVVMLIAVISIVSCKTVVQVEKSDQMKEYEVLFKKNYTVGDEKSIYVGEDVVDLQKYERSVFNAYKTIKSFDYPMYVGSNEYYRIWGKSPKGVLITNNDLTRRINERNVRRYATVGVAADFNGFAYEITKEGKLLAGVVLDDPPYYYPNDIGESTPQEVLFKEEDEVLLEYSKYKFKVVYQGMSGSVVKLQYEEYVDGLARDAFFKTFEYDLDNGKEISIKGILVEVIEANNSTLKYVVKDDANIYKWVK